MNKLIEENNGLIWSIVKRFNGRGYESDDLYQIGTIGFIKSIKRFDKTFEVKLSTYAVPYIIGEIKRFIRDDGSVKVSRSIKELNIKIKDIQNRYLREKGKEITIEEISKELNVSKEEITIAIDSINPTVSIYEDNYNNGENRISVLETLSTDTDEQEMITNKLFVKDLLEELNERERQLILLRYFKNRTQSEVAKILGVSQVQVSRIEKKIINSMREKII